jgi:hypothetical protein
MLLQALYWLLRLGPYCRTFGQPTFPVLILQQQTLDGKGSGGWKLGIENIPTSQPPGQQYHVKLHIPILHTIKRVCRHYAAAKRASGFGLLPVLCGDGVQ